MKYSAYLIGILQRILPRLHHPSHLATLDKCIYAVLWIE